MDEREWNKIELNFKRFREEIEKCLLTKDIVYFTDALKDILSEPDKNQIAFCENSMKVKVFISCFDRLDNKLKYKYFMNSAQVHNKWIFTFLSVDRNDNRKVSDIMAKWIVLDNTRSLISDLKDTFVFDKSFLCEVYNKDIISRANRDYLISYREKEGDEAALFEIFNVISMKDPDWYGNFLYIVARQKSFFINVLCEDLDRNTELDANDSETRCKEYAKKFIDKHMKQYEMENSPGTSSIEDNISDYGSLDDQDSFSDSEENLAGINNNSGESVAELKLHNFQLELTKEALTGRNVIIYAPTGSGKTNMAVYIANEHLRKNPRGKVLFLVHRIPLVTQQFNVFNKFKYPEFKVIEIRSKSENISGPLIAHLEMNDIIIMTSDILRNALTIDDGNKIESICKFSLIFFDECHNCMKSHPYIKIMNEYFKEKRLNSNKTFPQIIGLTASPRSNKKDDIPGMRKVLYELCANLNCHHIAIVKEHKEELNTFLSTPIQTLRKTNNRVFDDFETAIIYLMEICERKLEKMRNEKYFKSSELKSIPADKFKQDYTGFVGNLERLNTVTNDECDGKQKAYCIYRYLKAYHRGLIVNQMFDSRYANQAIKKNLNHNGEDFTCSFDEEFYGKYRDLLLNRQHEQSNNPAIDEILLQINQQMKENSDSRILVFVREIDFTSYLVDILKNTNNIAAEAIVGSNAKTDSKACSESEINNILLRFNNGTSKVLVATTVVEEGLDVALCNMVISYGHVTNETAMIQRRGRVRAIDSKYILILPPMLSWLEKKEIVNERRKEMMMRLINQIGSLDSKEMDDFVNKHQLSHFSAKEKRPVTMIDAKSWRFICKSCRAYICTSAEIRIIENAHRICLRPELLKRFKVLIEERLPFGREGNYEYGGKVLCFQCNNHPLGNYIHYRKVPFFQIDIRECNGINADGGEFSFKKWADFAKLHVISDLIRDERDIYCRQLEDLGIFDDALAI